jgi:hypothetical protein
MDMHVFICICTYLYVFVCICVYLFVFACICMYLCVSHSFFICAQAQTAAEIDELGTITTNIVVADDDDNYVTKDMRVVGIPVRMIIDMMAFTGVYGHKSTLETKRTNQGFRDSFEAYCVDIATNRAGEFWTSWKDFRDRNPLGDRPAGDAAPRPASVSALQADSDDEALLKATAGYPGDDPEGGGGDDARASGPAAPVPAAPAAPAAGAAAGPGGSSRGCGRVAAAARANPAAARADPALGRAQADD